MKNILPILFFSFLSLSISLHAQVEKVIVETYYISDSLDATDVQYISDINGNVIDSVNLPAGSTTYRVYVDLKSGYKLKKIYGDANHQFKITGDSNFFNNLLDGQSFGNKIAKNKFTANPTLVLDSWLTLGKAATTFSGILKAEDKDGSVPAIKNNNGGSSSVPEGLLHNADLHAGVPLDSADGLVGPTATAVFYSEGILDLTSNTDSTIFGSLKRGSEFTSNNVYLQLNSSGAMGTTDSNKVLVAQLTTRGKISFEFNMELLDTSGKSINCVAKSNYPPKGDTLICPYLVYPYIQACGCKDPNYLEYNASLVCSVVDSCKKRIVFGCMDPKSCNYDPNANFNIPSLCCYPGLCSDRDINQVCPSLEIGRNKSVIGFYPNPAHDQINVKISDSQKNETKYVIYDSFGRVVLEKNMGVFSSAFTEQVDISNLNTGIYFFRLFEGEDVSDNKMFMKK